MSDDFIEYSGLFFTSELHHDTYDLVDPAKLDLTGKYVLITGASRGLGKAMAVSYGKAGASGIALAARTPLEQAADEVKKAAKGQNRPDPKVLTIKCDTTSTKDVAALAKIVSDEFGKLDILINNAGYLEEFKPIVESDPNEWWTTFEINVKGMYLMTRQFIPLLLQSDLKTIVQVSSIGAHLVTRGASAYLMTKHAILRFNNFVMNEYGNQGLLAYSIHPGAVPTDLAMRMPQEVHDDLCDTSELCGDTVPWLTSEKRDWLADRYVSVTWDMNELLSKKDEIVKNNLLTLRMRV